jgi:hypothetical protein
MVGQRVRWHPPTIENASMSSEVVRSENYDAGKGLPPVAPPSGKFIIQLFLVPGLIVVVAVLILIGATWLVGGESAPDVLLERLENSNENVRWRAAEEIAQRLSRDPTLAANPKVALRLADLLRKAIDELNKAEQGLSEADRKKEAKTLTARRRDIEFLCPCVGKLILPTGAPLLAELALRKQGGDRISVVLLRRQAVFALANLGENVKRFDQLPPDQKDAVLEELRLAAASGGSSASRARLTLGYVEGTNKNLGVVEALAQCADTTKDPVDDPNLRELTAFAFTFWPGSDPTEEALAVKALVALAHDNGHGVQIENGENE